MDNREAFHFLLELTAVATGLAYLVEAARLRRICWIYGGISSLIYIYIFFNARLYVDGSLNTYYFAVAFVGWFGWQPNRSPRPVTRLRLWELAACISVSLALGAFLGFALQAFTRADYPLTDSFIGALSVTATWLTARKKIETWPLWIVADGTAAVLFFYKELYLTSALMLVYLILVAAAWVRWHKELKQHAPA